MTTGTITDLRGKSAPHAALIHSQCLRNALLTEDIVGARLIQGPDVSWLIKWRPVLFGGNVVAPG